MKKAGYEKVPVISLNISGLEKNSGFHITLPMIRRVVAAVVYGDELMLLRNQCKPYEIIAGESDRLEPAAGEGTKFRQRLQRKGSGKKYE